MLFTESLEYIAETGVQKWMNEALSKLKIKNVQVEYQPTNKKEPVLWEKSSRLLLIHEPDHYKAVLYFLQWVVSELPKQWKEVWKNLQHIEKNQGKKQAEKALQDYIHEKEIKKRRWIPGQRTLERYWDK
jgi:hypothetical protein